MTRQLALLAVLGLACTPPRRPVEPAAASRPAAESSPLEEPASSGIHLSLPARVHQAIVGWYSRNDGPIPAGTLVRLVPLVHDGYDDHDIVIARRERRSGARCEGQLVTITVADGVVHRPPQPLSADCCERGPCRRAAVGWQIMLFSLIGTKDLDGLRALVHPRLGLEVTTTCAGDETTCGGEPGSSTQRYQAAGLSLRAFSDLCGLTEPFECRPDEENRGFICTQQLGGATCTFSWAREQDRPYLVSIAASGD